jgi:glucose/arabinose dehydrogenase
VRDVATDLAAPWDVVFTAEGAFVSERDTGRVLRLQEGGEPEEVHRFAVDPTSEGGLLGLASHDGALYAYYTAASDNRVVRFRPGGTEEPVLTGIPKAGIHNGGRIVFGPDGMLYIGTGDAGAAGNAQDPASLAGKILRVTPDGDIPPDNPTPGSPVWSLGHRNVQGLAWSPEGELYATEFGPDRDDEINHIRPGGNYGWPEVTGVAGVAGFDDPVFVQQPPDAAWSGATFLVDGAVPQWEGDLLVASLRGQRLWRLTVTDGTVSASEQLLVGEYGRLRAAVQAPDGSIWVLTNNRDGRGQPRAGDDRIVRLGP